MSANKEQAKAATAKIGKTAGTKGGAKKANSAVAGSADAATGLNDETVREYLKNNDDFLQRYPDMLDYLHISHATGSAVSLVEKQVSVLRERNVDMRHRLSSLTKNAKDNDKLYEQTRTLVLKLIDAESVEALYKIFNHSMTRAFKVDHACMILYSPEPSRGLGYRVETPESAKHGIGSLFRGHKPVCGALRKEEFQYLFPEGGDVGSAALVPLGQNDPLGLIAVGSADANRYSSSVGTIFLSHIADVMVRLLPRLLSAAD